METPILLIIFNRPETTQIVFDAIKKNKPKYLYVAGDGARDYKIGELEVCLKTRSILSQINWNCEVKTLFQQENLGCFKAVNIALNWFFDYVEQGIILEDDCCPSENFFRFMEWGLETYKDDPQIGMICGSNLIEYKFPLSDRNGFSHLINIWGWASWGNTWKKHNTFLTIHDIQKNKHDINSYMRFNWWQKVYWNELFKFTVYLGSTWDFQLQHSFFRLKLLSVYPSKNLVFNLGFSGNGTHTNQAEPYFVAKTKPNDNYDILELNPNLSKNPLIKRDNLLAKEIWNYNLITTIKLKLMNLYRLNK